MIISTLNLRKGLRNKVKFLKQFISKTDILCLQETTEINTKIEKEIEEILNMKIYKSNGDNKSKGVAILVSKN